MEPQTLKQFQQLFCQATQSGKREELSSDIQGVFIPGGTLTDVDAINVYANGVTARLTEALGDMFEAVWWVCGDEDFFEITKHYLQAHPSTTYNLSSYGEQFPAYLEQINPFPDLPFLGALARYEWAFKELFHTAQHEPISTENIQALANDPSLFMYFGQAVRLFTTPYAIYDLWKLRGTPHEGKPPVEWDRPQHLVLYKQSQQIFVHEMGDLEFKILTALQTGLSLEDSLSLISEEEAENTQETISQLFQFLVNSGIIAKISKESPQDAPQK